MPRPLRLLRPRLRVRWLALAVLALIALLYMKPIRSYLGTRAELHRRTAEVHALRAQKLALERRLIQAASGDELVRQARRLGLVKPGERLFIVKGIGAWRRAHAGSPDRR
jgi:septum formation initiator